MCRGLWTRPPPFAIFPLAGSAASRCRSLPAVPGPGQPRLSWASFCLCPQGCGTEPDLGVRLPAPCVPASTRQISNARSALDVTQDERAQFSSGWGAGCKDLQAKLPIASAVDPVEQVFLLLGQTSIPIPPSVSTLPAPELQGQGQQTTFFPAA